MSHPTDPDVLLRAVRAYAAHAKQWTFLGYGETLALAILADFFCLDKPRNPSPKPLNVLSMVGRRRVIAIKEAQSAERRGQSEEGDEAQSAEHRAQSGTQNAERKMQSEEAEETPSEEADSSTA